MVRNRPAPTLGGRLASHAHYLKEGGFLKKYVMSLTLIVVIRMVIMCLHDVLSSLLDH